jgi:carboxypeptidase family protein
MQIHLHSCSLSGLPERCGGLSRSYSCVRLTRQRLWGSMKWGYLVFMALLLGTRETPAQSDRAAITGTVSDASGAAVQGAEVTATNTANGLQLRTVGNVVGAYSLLDLPIGKYTLVAWKEGFARYQRSGINLEIGQIARFDVRLSIQAGSETASVTSDPPLLQAQTASISTHLNYEAASELPQNVQGGRNLSYFMFAYVPSVEGTDSASHIGGSLSDNKEVMIDGTSAVSQIGGYLSESSPPMEAVQEFQVTTAGIRADDGRTGGGVFRYEMKMGSNAWHGSGLLYLHNEALDARSWGDQYNERVCLTAADGDPSQSASCQRAFGKPQDRLYDYGASVGGPIKKDKLFFYSAWERYSFANYGVGGLSSTVAHAGLPEGRFQRLAGQLGRVGNRQRTARAPYDLLF